MNTLISDQVTDPGIEGKTEEKSSALLSDPRAEAVLLGKYWHIDIQYGISVLGDYLRNLDLAASAQVSETVFERIKAMRAPAIVSQQGTVVSAGAVINGRNIPQGSILRLNLIGPMFTNGDICTWGMDDFEEAISLASQNPNIDGVFIYANSGGGESLAGQKLHNAVKSSKKAVVVYTDFLGSAALLGTVAADEIIASGPEARIGSIGAYFSISKELANWYKDNVEDVYGDPSTEKNQEWRAYLDGDTSLLRRVATQSAKNFQAEVKKHRELKGDTEGTLRGGMFFAAEAKSRGLIDSVGTIEYAYTRLQSAIKRRKNMQ